MAHAELITTTNFTFLTGASHPEEMVERAAALGLEAIAITDRNSLAGVVRGWARLKDLRKEFGGKAGVGGSADRARGTAPNITGADVVAHAKKIRVRKDPSGREEAPDPPEPNADPDFIPLSIPKLIVGTRLALEDSCVEWIALPTDRAAYGRLSRLLSTGKRRAEKGQCHLYSNDLEALEGCVLLAVVGVQSSKERAAPDPPRRTNTAADALGALVPVAASGDIEALAHTFPNHVFTAVTPRYDGGDPARFAALAQLAEDTGAPLVAASDAMMHHARRRRLGDVLTAIRTGCTVDDLGALALPNAERRLRSADEMARIFADYPDALARAREIAALINFDLGQLRYEYPDEVAAGEDPQARLIRLTEEGLAWRYPHGAPEKVHAAIRKELGLIQRLDYARYFLTVNDIVQFARSREILCQGRGSAANSVVCYCLGITEANPEMISAVFERFVSEARGEPPDIDVDFEHERREEVIQHIYARYGRHRAGLCATVIHFRARAALREVGKVMGLSTDVVSALASQIWGWSSDGINQQRVREMGLDPADRTLRMTMDLVQEIIGFPRHLSQHVGGFVITRERLDEYVPIENAAMENRTVIEWDKDDIDALGMLKVDVLALGMLTCMRKGFDLLAQHGGPRLTLDTMPKEDPRVYDMLCVGDSLGVFQVESRAQMNFLPRMKPRCFYDLVIEVAIVRPGPIQGDMVHPYLRRRNGEEAVDYVKDELRQILGKTLGVPLFQEQAMEIAMTAADFTPDEADGLRRAMATFRKTGTIHTFGERFIARMIEKGYPEDFAARCFKQIEGFGEYGFPESHAASFALLVYASSWMKHHHPAVFACALLNSQPMGFYAPAQIVRDAREHGVEVRPVCVNASAWDCSLEPVLESPTAPRPLPATHQGGNLGGREGVRGDERSAKLALRLGLRQIKGLKQNDAEWINAARHNGYPDVESVWQRAGVGPAALARLAEADAFAAMGLSRRDALWQAKAITAPKPLPLFGEGIEGEGIAEPDVALPALSLGGEVVEDYIATRLSLKAHPMALLRDKINSHTISHNLTEQRNRSHRARVT